jgi:predicted O-methyltransferase YrrM
MGTPKLHRHAELMDDIGVGFVKDEIISKWFNDYYSTSKHLFTLYSIVRGLNAQKVLEIGFGRSTFVLAKATYENGGMMTACDIDDYKNILSSEEKKVVNFIHGDSSMIWSDTNFYDFAFLDYFSNKKMSTATCANEIRKCLRMMRTNGIIAVHDTDVGVYAINKLEFNS